MNIDLHSYESKLNLIVRDKKKYFVDPVRKKPIRLQPEELVRQLWMLYLHHHHDYPYNSMAVEKQLKVGTELIRRYDLVVHKQGIPMILFEFKRYSIQLDSAACLQIAQYNMTLKIPFLILSNGHTHFGYKVNHQTKAVKVLQDWPTI